MEKKKRTAIVIGSGFGGAVAACRLAQAGVSVTLLERGRRYDQDPQLYPRGPLDSWLWAEDHGLYDVIPISEMVALQAAGYGGGSLIYANVHLRAPGEVFERGWPKGYSRSMLDPYYDLVAYMLDIEPITKSPLGLPPKSQQMKEAASRLSRDDAFLYPPLAVRFAAEEEARPNKFGVKQGGCTHCGECIIGCKNYSKNTLDRNYLALAERLGARMLTEREVVSIEPTPNGEPGYRVFFRDIVTGFIEKMEAAFVFVCAGAIHSTAILLRSKAQGQLPQISSKLGGKYSGNGDFLAFSFDTEKPWDPNIGPTITTALLYQGKGSENAGWFLLEEGGLPETLWPLLELARPKGPWFSPGPMPPGGMGDPGPTDRERGGPPLPTEIADTFRKKVGVITPPEDKRMLPVADAPSRFVDGRAAMRNTAIFLAMGRDLANGSIELTAKGHIHIRWDVPSNLSLYSLEDRLSRDVSSAFGGSFAATPFWQFAHLPVSVHNLGGCVMGNTEEEGVTSSIGEVFNYPGLFVMDGALLPAATGVNPAHTICAVAERNMEQIVRNLLGEGDWVAPERKVAKPFLDPLSMMTLAPNGSAAPSHAGVSIGFHESLTGHFSSIAESGEPHASRGPVVDLIEKFGEKRHSAFCELEIVVPNIAELIAGPAHVAIAKGRVFVESLTHAEGASTTGVWSVEISEGNEAEREVRYALPFIGQDGQPYTLYGTKAFRPHPDISAFSRHTLVKFRVREGDARDGRLLGSGELTMGLKGILNLAASLRETGPSSPIEKAQALAMLLKFYFGTAAQLAGLG